MLNKKKYFRYLLLFIVFFVIFWNFTKCFWFDTQWFESFNQTDNKNINFNCNWECFMIWDSINENAKIVINWKFEWNWEILIWFYLDEKIFFLSNLLINWKSILNQSLSLNNFNWINILKKIDKSAKIVFFFKWQINWENANLNLEKINFKDYLEQLKKLFIWEELITFYNINLRYWNSFFDYSIVYIWYIVWFFLIIFSILYFNKNKLLNWFYIFLILYILIWSTQILNYLKINYWLLTKYTFANENQREYPLILGFHEKVDKIRQILKKENQLNNNCKIFLNCQQEWPYCTHMEFVFIKPCKRVNQVEKSNVILFYNSIPNISWYNFIDLQDWNFLAFKKE